jgi:hypothetical protein
LQYVPPLHTRRFLLSAYLGRYTHHRLCQGIRASLEDGRYSLPYVCV